MAEDVVLAALADADGPVDRWALCDAVQGRPERVDNRTREGKAWTRRRLELLRAVYDLERSGLVRTVVDGGDGEPRKITLTAAARV